MALVNLNRRGQKCRVVSKTDDISSGQAETINNAVLITLMNRSGEDYVDIAKSIRSQVESTMGGKWDCYLGRKDQWGYSQNGGQGNTWIKCSTDVLKVLMKKQD